MITAALSILIAWFPGAPAPVWLYAYEDHDFCVGMAEVIPDTACLPHGSFPQPFPVRPVSRPADLCHPVRCGSLRPVARNE